MLVKFTKKMNEKINHIREQALQYQHTKISGAREIVMHIRAFESNLDPIEKEKERFYAVGLTTSGKIKYIDNVSTGTIDSCTADPLQVFRIAILSGVRYIVIAHNHPSGNTEPSDADIKMTKKLKEGSKWLDLTITDHIIFSDDDYYSFSADGLIL